MILNMPTTLDSEKLELPNPDSLPPGSTIGDMEVKKIGMIGEEGAHYWRKSPSSGKEVNTRTTPLLDHPSFMGKMPHLNTMIPLREALQISRDYFDFRGAPEWLKSPKLKQYLASRGIKKLELDTEVPFAVLMGPVMFDRFLEDELEPTNEIEVIGETDETEEIDETDEIDGETVEPTETEDIETNISDVD